MDAHLSFSVTLLASLVLWWGSMRATLAGDLDLTASGLRFVLAFVLARTAMGVINHLLTGYHREVQQPATRRGEIGGQGHETVAASGDTRMQSVNDAGDAPNRRRTDQSPPQGATLDSASFGTIPGESSGFLEEGVPGEP